MGTRIALMLVLMSSLAGCADLGCYPACKSHVHNASSLVDFLYPDGAIPPAQDALPELHLPLRIGLSFLPAAGDDFGPGAADKEAVLQQIRERFLSRHFVADIVVIPDYYLQHKTGFAGLAGVQRLYGVDLMALVSYDQVAHEDGNNWSLGYLTIVGAYVLKGTRHDVSTLVDLAIVDPVTHSLVLRAGGVDSREGNDTWVSENRSLRENSTQGFNAASAQMIENFDTALTAFEADVRSGRAQVKVVSAPESGGALH